MAEHERMEFLSWGDDKVLEFMEVLPELVGVKVVIISP